MVMGARSGPQQLHGRPSGQRADVHPRPLPARPRIARRKPAFLITFARLQVAFLLLCAASPTSSLDGCSGTSPACLCTDLIATCTGRQLPAVPTDLPSTIETLNLGDNNITSVVVPSFVDGSLAKVTLLSLTQNRISVLPSSTGGLFRGMPALSAIILSNNHITHIAAGAFNGLPMLSRIFLEKNQLSSFSEPMPFSQNLNLRHLDFGGNPLGAGPPLPSTLFANLSKLTTLSMPNANLSAAHLATHSPLAELRAITFLDLQENPFGRLVPEMFRSPTQTSQPWSGFDMLLNGCQLTSLAAGVFRGMVAREISLSENPLSALNEADGVFEGAKAVRLGLESTRLTELVGAPFRPLSTTLTVLKLSSSNLTQLHPTSLEGLDRLETLELKDSPIERLWPFPPLPSLTSLILSNLDLSSLTPLGGGISIFANLTAITLLELDKTRLGAVIGEEFQGLNSVRLLHMEEAEISAVSSNLFLHLHLLNNLVIYRNRLTQLPVFFPPSNVLNTFRLEGNDITTLSNRPFRHGFAALRNLDLESNLLTAIADGDLDGLYSLRDLDLDNNRLTVFASASLTISLREVTLVRNLLTALPPSPALANADVVCLNGNPIQCADFPTDLACCEFNALAALRGLDKSCDSPATCGGPHFLTGARLLGIGGVPYACKITCPTFAPTSQPTEFPTLAPVAVPTPPPTQLPTTAPTATRVGAASGGGGGGVVPTVGIALGVLVLVVGAAAALYVLVTRRSRAAHQNDLLGELAQLMEVPNVKAVEAYETRFASVLAPSAECERRVRELEQATSGSGGSNEVALSSQVLGEGEHGRVLLGHMGAGSTPVAVKMLHEGKFSGPACVNLLLEARVLAVLPPHENVVQLLGLRVWSAPVMLVLEHCSEGNLRELLLRQRAGGGSVGEAPLSPPSAQTLAGFGWQVARAVAFFHSKMLVHRDLAARNVLVHRRPCGLLPLTLKLADLGLARGLQGSDSYYYRKTSDTAEPVKWMCPTAVALRRFTKKSDVWSFGVLLWEIFTLGETPWRDLLATEVLVKAQQGQRLPRPPPCPEPVYALMLACWAREEAARPAMPAIEQALDGWMRGGVPRQAWDGPGTSTGASMQLRGGGAGGEVEDDDEEEETSI